MAVQLEKLHEIAKLYDAWQQIRATRAAIHKDAETFKTFHLHLNFEVWLDGDLDLHPHIESDVRHTLSPRGEDADEFLVLYETQLRTRLIRLGVESYQLHTPEWFSTT